VNKWVQRLCALGLSIGITTTCLAGPMQSAQEEGKAIGGNGAKEAFSQISNIRDEDFISPDQSSDVFDPQKAKEIAKKGITPKSESVEYLTSDEVRKNTYDLNENEYFLKRSEDILEKAKEGEIPLEDVSEYSLETCQQTDAPYPISLTRNLQVEVSYEPGVTRNVQYCLGHSREKRFSKKKSAKNTAQKWREEFASDPSIKEFHVDVRYKGVLHKHVVEASWKHHENVNNCNNYQTQEEVVSEPKWEEIGETWVYEDNAFQELSKSPHCTYLEKTCIDNTPSKTINGKEVKRQSWKEKITFLCKLPNPEDCPFLRDQNCELIKKDCLKEGPYGCTLWELTFKCYSKIFQKRIGEGEFFGMDEEPEYEPNDSFSEVAAKLAVFDEIKNELQDSQAQDARYVQVFKGQALECGKNIADELMYDCCFSFSGLAKDLKFKQCNEEELTLAEMREHGLCHYVGSYPEKFHDLWKSRDKHVFCCYKTKLGRVLQEQAIDQLNRSWGEPKHADCRGLTIEEIASLDFSRMDFSELHSDFDGALSDKFKNKLESLQKKVKDKMEDKSNE